MKYSIYKQWREHSSQRTNISPTKTILYIQIAWQPSLVLGDLGRARVVPIACEGSSLGLALQPTKANNKVHRLGVSKKRT